MKTDVKPFLFHLEKKDMGALNFLDLDFLYKGNLKC